MSDFVSGLRAELVTAAEREQARRVTWRLPEPRFLLAGLAGAAALAAVLVLLASGGLRTEPGPPEPAETPVPEGRELFGGSLEPEVRYRTRAFVPALSFAVPDDLWFVPDASAADLLVLQRRQFEQGDLRLEGPPTGFLGALADTGGLRAGHARARREPVRRTRRPRGVAACAPGPARGRGVARDARRCPG